MKNAVMISYWGVPIIIFIFVGTYWILGLNNYINPSKKIVVAEEEVEEEDNAFLMIVGMVGTLVVLLFCALWWYYPDISARMQRKKKKTQIGSQQTLVQSKTAFEESE